MDMLWRRHDKEMDTKMETLHFNELVVAARVLRNWERREHSLLINMFLINEWNGEPAVSYTKMPTVNGFTDERQSPFHALSTDEDICII
jgi:hypothetical protein